MRLASTDSTWPGLRAAFVLDLIAELGLDGVSLFFAGGLTARDPADVAADPEGSAARVAAEVAERGLEVADVFCIPNADLVTSTINHPDAAQRAAGDEVFDRFVEFAARLGVSGVTTLPGLIFGGENWSTAAERSVPALRRRVEVAGERGLRVSIEPHVLSALPYAGSLADTPATVGALLEQVPGLELTLDYGHFNIQRIPDREVEPLLAHARHVHMRGGAPGLIQTRLDENVTDFRRILDRLQAIGYDGWIEIEYVYGPAPDCPDVDTIQEVRKLRDLVRDHLAAPR